MYNSFKFSYLNVTSKRSSDEIGSQHTVLFLIFGAISMSNFSSIVLFNK